MRIAVIGRGGREHALCWKLAQEVGEMNVFCLPGNGGTPNRRAVDEMDFGGIRACCEAEGIELVVVGPEAPLAAGIVDELTGGRIRVFGPTRAAARLEASKAWSKQFMQRHGIATAVGAFFASPREAAAHVAAETGGVVVKYSGLAAGKGVFVCRDADAGLDALREIENRHGAEATVVVEELLEGPEVSVMGVTDGRSIQLMPPSRDHKRLLDGDAGPNTGGMGAFTPVPDVGPEQMAQIERDVIAPTLKGFAADGIGYRGFLYFGVMLTAAGPKLLEYNARLGDPETEILLPTLGGGLLPTILAAMDGTLDRTPFAVRPGAVVDVVLAAGGYPGNIQKGVPITGIESSEALVFHAGTEIRDGRLAVSGGRVLNVVAHGADLAEARDKAYGACEQIHFDGMQYRRDIGAGRGRA